jgi:uncharacterized membrane protein YphA (DoxX/SURF4 family)
MVRKSIMKKNSVTTLLLLFRIILGFTLFIKGINFVSNQEFLERLISNTVLLKNLSFLKIVIPFIHILGGFLILIGVYSRLMILIQLPIIIAAIVFLLISGGMSYYREIVFAFIILILLMSYLKFGDGFYSWKNLINNEKNII